MLTYCEAPVAQKTRHKACESCGVDCRDHAVECDSCGAQCCSHCIDEQYGYRVCPDCRD